MHRSVENHIEEFLEGRLSGAPYEAFHSHIAQCRECFDLVDQMRQHSALLVALRAPAEVEPPPGFYGRVMRRIDAQGRPSFWSLLLDPVFGRRLVYGTASLVILMGVFLLATEPNRPEELATTPVHTLAIPNPEHPQLPGSDAAANMQANRDTLLVTLATFSDPE